MSHAFPVEYELSPTEADQIHAHVKEHLARTGPDAPGPADPAFYDRHWDAGLGLPEGLRKFLEHFRRTEPSAALVVHGFPVDDAAVGPTPGHWDGIDPNSATLEQEFFLAMCGSALGDPYTFSTLQLGRMVQNLLPIKGDELRQNGHSSECLLEFHTEDGFHPGRCDYLLLFGVRNHDRVPTIVASVRDVRLSERDIDVLRSPRFLIRPDDEHIRQLQARCPDHPALARMVQFQAAPPAVPVISGEHERPYLRIDYPFMECVGGDTAAQRALDALMAELERVQQNVVVGQGSLAVVDNYVAVHGRRAFRARLDGSDRWLKRMIVSRDLRKSVASIKPDSARVLY